ncbi:hypothetical protein GH714_029455 [Hevea brasiliensis]|uniref:SHSP domain-containing protein n=1 Tax=Hevea brasiliensis TaxID=3981 RepID=A0A6A6LVK5_HEVBR|nr:hypothetical protein GH714_029455 [Hevea brasiliensis]
MKMHNRLNEDKALRSTCKRCVTSLLSLIREDALVLDRFIASCFTETPLHIASMLGHLEFAKDPKLKAPICRRSRFPRTNSTSLGNSEWAHLQVVKAMLLLNPQTRLFQDRNGRSPLHVAVNKGRFEVLQENCGGDVIISLLIKKAKVDQNERNSYTALDILNMTEEQSEDFLEHTSDITSIELASQHVKANITYLRPQKRAMDIRLLDLQSPLLSTIHHLMDTTDEAEKSFNAPTRTYVRDAKAMASTPADVKEYPNSYVFIIDMPGLKSGDIKVQVEDDNVLLISGEGSVKRKGRC